MSSGHRGPYSVTTSAMRENWRKHMLLNMVNTIQMAQRESLSLCVSRRLANELANHKIEGGLGYVA